ncbi:MAG TPA: heme-binding protein [Burkholderiales bacterium]|nr:heme-binding protein [Burkholderiales bacterium]
MAALTLAQADTIMGKALEKARAEKSPPLAVVVLDGSGHLKAARREDGASMFRFDVAHGKAWAAVAMGSSSRAVAKRAKDNPNFIGALAVTAGGKFLPQPGAVLIRGAGDEILGAVGISGAKADEDEAFGAYGVEQAGLKAEI